MSWANQIHKQRERESRRNREILSDGQIFYDVAVLGMWRTLLEIGMAEDEAENVINKYLREMFDIYDEPADYHKMCIEETGIEIVMQ